MTDQPSSTADVSVADKGKGKAPEDEMIDMEEDLSGASESSEEEVLILRDSQFPPLPTLKHYFFLANGYPFIA